MAMASVAHVTDAEASLTVSVCAVNFGALA